jgi:ferredoxin
LQISFRKTLPEGFTLMINASTVILCRETAPANFARDSDGGHSFVYKQPENADEEALCREAIEGCPVEAIGDDGE